MEDLRHARLGMLVGRGYVENGKGIFILDACRHAWTDRAPADLLAVGSTVTFIGFERRGHRRAIHVRITRHDAGAIFFERV